MTKNFAEFYYPDLVDSADSAGQRLVAELHTLFNPAVPSGLRDIPTPQRAARRTFSLRLPPWPRTALVAVLAIFALVGATYVVLPLLQQIWSGDRGLAHVARAGLVRNLDLAQTKGGVTVRLQRAYMDANRLVVGYTVELPNSGATEAGPSFADATLTDDTSMKYRQGASTYADGSPLGAHVLNFETPAAESAARDITFTLTIPRPRAGAGGTPKETFSDPWVFTFALASTPSHRVIEPSLTVTASDVRLTFTRVVVAPSATRFYYRLTRTGTSGVVTGSIGLRVDGRFLNGAGGCERDGQCFFIATEPLFDLQTLTVDELIISADSTPADRDAQQLRIRGPFVVPLR